jgi:type II secretory pathway component PulF
MTDQAKGPSSARKPVPHLQTRPATMLTAIGLCVIIMLIQLVPEFQSIGMNSRIPTSVTASAR